MKCCFCGAELRELKEAGTVVGLFCPDFCITRLAMDKETWQALIDGKRAQDALKEIKKTLDECFSSDKSGFTVFWDVIARRVHSVITHSTKGESNE